MRSSIARRMKMSMAAIAFVFAAVATVTAFGQTQASPSRDEAKDETGFKLKGIDGKTYDTSDMRGNIVVVSFGASWCAPCVWELAAIEELKAEYAKRPVKFLWVSIESEKRTSNNVLRHYAKSQRLTIPVLRDPEAELFSRYSSSTRLPLVVFLNREGRNSPPVHHGMPQDVTGYKMMMRERIDALLAEGEARTRTETPDDSERD